MTAPRGPSRRARPTAFQESIRQRLYNLARQHNEEFQYVLMRYGIERFLYRLSQSPHRDRFTLKGAMLFQVWTGHSHRPTRDLDLLGHGVLDADAAAQLICDICRHPVADDGLTFDDATITIDELRQDEDYHGLRISLRFSLGVARVPLQIDVGIGDAVTPTPRMENYPTLLDFPAPRLRSYPRETVVAEKFQAMVALGIANSRVKDFYDLWILARDFPFDGATLSRAIAATFQRRQTDLPADTPHSLLPDFWKGGTKWQAFFTRYRMDPQTAPLDDALALLRRFLLPVTAALRAVTPFNKTWAPGDNWG